MNNDTAKQFGEQIKHLRQARKLSIRGLANKCGVDSGTLTRMEHGTRHNPQPGTLKCLAEGLGTPLADLFAMAGYVTPRDLPSLSYYLRVKYYHLPQDVLDRLERDIRRLLDEYRVKEVKIDWDKEIF
jgi:transcriptional regulator with XRE-family HTH domain